MALDQANPGALPCGTLLDDLIAQVTDATGPIDRVHQLTCRHCQAALAAIRETWEEFQQVARAAVALPEDLTERILRRVRTLSFRSDGAVMIVSARGETSVADRALARLARGAALDERDVLLATVLSTDEDPQSPGNVVVELRLVVRFGPPIDQVTAGVRRRIDRILRTRAGVGVSRVDISIEDVVAERDPSS